MASLFMEPPSRSPFAGRARSTVPSRGRTVPRACHRRRQGSASQPRGSGKARPPAASHAGPTHSTRRPGTFHRSRPKRAVQDATQQPDSEQQQSCSFAVPCPAPDALVRRANTCPNRTAIPPESAHTRTSLQVGRCCLILHVLAAFGGSCGRFSGSLHATPHIGMLPVDRRFVRRPRCRPSPSTTQRCDPRCCRFRERVARTPRRARSVPRSARERTRERG